MRFRGQREVREHGLGVDLTPMIDVVFLLIIFFLTTAQFARLTRADIELPLEPGENAERQDEPGIIINIAADGQIIVDDQEITLEELRRIVEGEVDGQPGRQPDRVKLLLRADRNLSAARVNEVVRMLREIGVGLGRFATEVPR